MIAFLFSAAGRRLVAAVGAVLLLLALAGYIDHRGYQRAAGQYSVQIAQMKAEAATARANEIERQLAANNAAKAREAQRLAEMRAENEELQNKIVELGREADEDPDANRPALSAAGVRRIDRIK